MSRRLVAVIVSLAAAGLVGCKDARGARDRDRADGQ
jgi:hypothetical protein